MKKLSKYEKETIINWNEAENLASIYTFNASLKRRLAYSVPSVSRSMSAFSYTMLDTIERPSATLLSLAESSMTPVAGFS